MMVECINQSTEKQKGDQNEEFTGCFNINLLLEGPKLYNPTDIAFLLVVYVAT
jgi:hypothetical protein